MLSNTATPKYYGRFRDAVLRGEIPVNKEIEAEMNRIDGLIASPDYYYSPDKVEGWIRFCESELVLSDGSNFHMLDSFKLWGEELFGWYYFVEEQVWNPNGLRGGRGCYETRSVKKRLTTKQYLIVGRGAAKTIYATCIQAYYLIIESKTTTQVMVAPTMPQTEETIGPLITAITKARGPLLSFMTQGSINNTTGSKRNRPMLYPTKKGIQNFLTNSILQTRPMSVDRLQGRRDTVSTVDELFSGDIREDPVEALEQGATKNLIGGDYVIVVTSSEGTVRNGAGDTAKIELSKILRGEKYDPHTSIWWYKLDDVKEVNNPYLWLKANPNIGKTVSYETYQQEVDRAESDPSQRNDILAKRFGIPCEGFTYFFTYEETLPFSAQNYNGMPCSLGCDLSQGGDFCSFTFLFPLNSDAFGIKTLNFISQYTMDKLPVAMYNKYEEFVKEGSLIIMNGTVLDMQEIYDLVDNHIIAHDYDVRCLGYDPYNAAEFISRWSRENSEYGVEKVIQGAKTESVPLTELKKLSEQRKLIFDEKLFSYTMGNCIIIQDTNGNKKLMKKTYEAKIDAVAAMMDAFVAFKLNKDSFY
ncbi:terminase TerL endonuclease subunit [Lachnoclostridium sp. Marseille-P6806]|uniref:terminase TerL endonuclease subunit n=1 Tax=Lachnoclostridium sp. Marseille-P6806 TaxID=2364793 RepID=UPI001031CCF4|nr:terminase TerL endonuclease subunit [Lachnoclostridium sp. Marseille-P6806]